MPFRTSALVSAVLALLMLAGCDDSDAPLAGEDELHYTIQPNGTVIECHRLWNVGARHDSTDSVQRVVEQLVKEYEPFVYQRTPHPVESNVFIVRREIIIRGDVLDCYSEQEYPAGVSQTFLRYLVTNDVFVLPLNDREVEIRHNGTEQQWMGDDSNMLTMAVWPTNTTYIWLKVKEKERTIVPCAWAYKAYLDNNRAFPWRKQESTTAPQ